MGQRAKSWYVLDPAEAARVAGNLRRFDERRALEAAHAGVGLRFVPPVNSDLGRWEAFWVGGEARADTDMDLYAMVCARLGDVSEP